MLIRRHKYGEVVVRIKKQLALLMVTVFAVVLIQPSQSMARTNRGSLSVKVSGVPGNYAASIIISGNGVKRTITSSTVLTKLKAGSYKVEIAPLMTLTEEWFSTPVVRTVVVMGNRVTKIEVNFKRKVTTKSVRSIAPGVRRTCVALKPNGARCWGANEYGQLGDGTKTDRFVPTPVANLESTSIKQISAGGNHTCVLTLQGGVKCWGMNLQGQLGDGTWEDSSTPVDVVGLSSGVTRISVGSSHTCAITTTGGLKCWGDGTRGQLGIGRIDVSIVPVDVPGLTSGVIAVAASGLRTCAVISDGSVKCWGLNDIGELGDGRRATAQDPFHKNLSPADVIGLSSGVKDVVGGYSYFCALMVDGEVKCWGYEYSGNELGAGDLPKDFLPGMVLNVVGLSSPAVALSATSHHTCALLANGSARCWGFNSSGELGSAEWQRDDDAPRKGSSPPVKVVGINGRVSAIGAGALHTCALTEKAELFCWGYNIEGQVGIGETKKRRELRTIVKPTRVR